MAPADHSYASASAPLPSPSASQSSSSYFQSQNRQRSTTSIPQTAQAPTSNPQSQQQLQHSQNNQQPAASKYGAVNGTDSYGKEKEFCLVAEAAKRAQMAVLMRDMGEVGLS